MTQAKTKNILYASMQSPIGSILIAVTPRGICEIAIAEDKEARLQWLTHRYNCVPLQYDAKGNSIDRDLEESSSIINAAQKEINNYFKGQLKDFNLPLDPHGSPFEVAVWQAIKGVPFGETRSYSWVAARIKKPQAARAVGTACGKNPIPIIVPCHRIISKDGGLGGYSAGYNNGITIKKALLNLENIAGRVFN